MESTRDIRVIADVHGYPERLLKAAGDSASIVLLGDLVDRGPDSPQVLRLVIDWVEKGRARLVRSNHDDKLYRALIGREVKMGRHIQKTLNDLKAAHDADGLIQRFIMMFEESPFFIEHGRYVMAHGAVSPDYFAEPASPQQELRGKAHMALFGEVDGTMNEDGKPVRFYNWVDTIPPDRVVVVGHDRRFGYQPHIQTGALGGRAFFMDTGCGKGGPLSYVDLPSERIGQVGSLPAI